MAFDGLMRKLSNLTTTEGSFSEQKLTVLRALAVTPFFRDFASLGGLVVLVMRFLGLDARRHFGLPSPLSLTSLIGCPLLLQL